MHAEAAIHYPYPGYKNPAVSLILNGSRSIRSRGYLQVLEDGVDVGDLEDVLLALLGSVGDLAVVNDQTVTVGAALGIGPANTLRELGLGIGEEEL